MEKNWEIKVIGKKKKIIEKFMTSQKRNIKKGDIDESIRDSENQVKEAIGAIGKNWEIKVIGKNRKNQEKK